MARTVTRTYALVSSFIYKYLLIRHNRRIEVLLKWGISMPQDDYRGKIEEHRQAIYIEPEEEEKNPSRMKRRHQNDEGKQKKNQSKPKLLTALAIVFILIPISTLIYFSTLSHENSHEKAEIESDSGVHIETNSEKEKVTTQASKKEEQEQLKKEQAAQKEADRINAEKVKKEQAENAKLEAQKEKEEQAANAELEAQKVKQQQLYEEAKAAGRLYNVKAGETIESIAINFYGSTAGIAIIQEANGITGNTVAPGTTIAIPAQK